MRRARIAAVAATIAVALLAGCQYPRDVEDTLERVEGGTLRVGVSQNDPWVNLEDSPPTGVEPEIVRGFATTIDAELHWVRGDSAELVEALANGQLDIVIAGLDRKSEHQRKVALTRPYVDTELLLAHPPGQEMPEEDDGAPVAVEADSQAAGLLDHKTDYGLLELEDMDKVRGPALVWDYWLDDLPLESTGEDLIDEEHCMAVRFGENAFLVELERYLLSREGVWRRVVNEVGKP